MFYLTSNSRLYSRLYDSSASQRAEHNISVCLDLTIYHGGFRLAQLNISHKKCQFTCIFQQIFTCGRFSMDQFGEVVVIKLCFYAL